MVDVEADVPIPGDYSMISLGAVLVDEAQPAVQVASTEWLVLFS